MAALMGLGTAEPGPATGQQVADLACLQTDV
jgi:hypothetical protein